MKDKFKSKGMSKKDWIIIGLSFLLLVLLAVLVIASRKNDKSISEKLVMDSTKKDTEATPEKEKNSVELVISELGSSGFVEFCNNGTDDIVASGYSILINGNKVCDFPDGTTISKGSYYSIDIGVNPGEKANSYLVVQNLDGEAVCAICVPAIAKGKSYGLIDIAGYDMAFMDETKNEQNVPGDNPVYAEINGIGFSVPCGFYDSEFKLTLVSESGNKIYYTTDGSEPTTDSALYSNPIFIKNRSGQNYVYAKQAVGNNGSVYYPGSVDRGEIVRAIEVDSSGKVVGSASESYFIGFRMDSDYLNIPVISLIINPEDLFDYFNGIYVSGRSREDEIARGGNGQEFGNYYNGWERKAKIEYFEPGKVKSFEGDISIKIKNDSSITDRQKGLVFSLSDYEPAEFLGSSVQKFISNSGTFEITQNYNDNDVKIRDYLLNEMMADSSVGTAELMPVILFIDGEYWGLYTIKAPYDKAYIERQYGVSSNEILFHTYGSYQREFTEVNNFVVNNDMSDPENYRQVSNMIDIDSYLEYVCMNIFVGNTSFGSLKTTQWRTKETSGSKYCDGKWRWLMSRMDSSLCNSNLQTYTIDSFLQPGFTHDKFLQSLLMNKDFCNRLYSTMEKLVEEQLTLSKAEEVLKELDTLLNKPTNTSRQRFYGKITGKFDSEVDKIYEFFENRKDYILLYAKETSEKGGDLSFVETEETEETDENGNDAEQVEDGMNGISLEVQQGN